MNLLQHPICSSTGARQGVWGAGTESMDGGPGLGAQGVAVAEEVGVKPAHGPWFERLAKSDPWWPRAALQARQPRPSGAGRAFSGEHLFWVLTSTESRAHRGTVGKRGGPGSEPPASFLNPFGWTGGPLPALGRRLYRPQAADLQRTDPPAPKSSGRRRRTAEILPPPPCCPPAP